MYIVVHGGAGAPPAEPITRQHVVDTAAVLGSRAQTAVAAVRAAIEHLERSPRFNAGVGAAVQSDGRIRTDAGLMTDGGDVGAVCAMEDVADAIAVANAVRTETPHDLLAGPSAVRFAASQGIETGIDLWSDRTRDRWEALEIPAESVEAQLVAVNANLADPGTVGAVATDGDEIVAGTSTGGRWCALAGRVGDVPQVGGGFFASPVAGVSTTGVGEQIARLGLARRTVDLVAGGTGATDAADAAIRAFEGDATGPAGVVVLTPEGSIGHATCAEVMQTAAARDGRSVDLS